MKSTPNLKKEKKKQASKPVKVYLDANLFIYAYINIETIGENAKIILEDVKKGKYKAYTATLTIDEFLWKLQNELDKKLAIEASSIFFNLPNLILIPVDMGVITKAVEVYQKEDLDPRDSIHIASMKTKGIKKIFSSDSDLDRIKEIKRIDFTN